MTLCVECNCGKSHVTLLCCGPEVLVHYSSVIDWIDQIKQFLRVKEMDNSQRNIEESQLFFSLPHQ